MATIASATVALVAGVVALVKYYKTPTNTNNISEQPSTITTIPAPLTGVQETTVPLVPLQDDKIVEKAIHAKNMSVDEIKTMLPALRPVGDPDKLRLIRCNSMPTYRSPFADEIRARIEKKFANANE
jgi:hypothetical protein